VPTAENLAKVAFDLLEGAYRDTFGNNLKLERVRLFETPNNWVDSVR
jgi:6-pyruvoyltetrahydropterin/6-carboxytetrahydropterin synthase